MALGATKDRIYSLTLGDAALPVLVGLAAGWLASVAAGRLIQAMLYGVGSTDATVSATVAALFLTAAFAAAFFPARRAASTDSIEALRTE